MVTAPNCPTSCDSLICYSLRQHGNYVIREWIADGSWLKSTAVIG